MGNKSTRMRYPGCFGDIFSRRAKCQGEAEDRGTPATGLEAGEELEPAGTLAQERRPAPLVISYSKTNPKDDSGTMYIPKEDMDVIDAMIAEIVSDSFKPGIL